MKRTVQTNFFSRHRRGLLFSALGIVVLIVIASVFIYQRNKLRSEKIMSEFVEMESHFVTIREFKEENHKDRAEAYSHFFHQFRSHPLAVYAGIVAASDYRSIKKTEESIAILEEVLQESHKDLIQIRLRYSLATMYFEKSMYEKALAEVAILETLRQNPIEHMISLLKAEILYFNGQKAEARLILESLSGKDVASDDYTDNRVKQEASSWLSYWDFN